jgi:PAS domain S-box-containing protein
MQIRKPTKPLIFSFEKKVVSFFFVVAILFASILLVFKKLNNRNIAVRNLVRISENILAQTDSITLLEKDLIIHTRGYVITGSPKDLAAILHLRAMLDKQLDNFKTIALKDTSSLFSLKQVDSLIHEYYQMSEKAIGFRKRENFSLADEIPVINLGDILREQMDNTIYVIRQKEKLSLRLRRSEYADEVKRSSIAIRTMIVLLIVSLIGAFILVYRNATRRNKAERALVKSQGLVKAIIDHAPVLISVKDRFGKFILANEHFAAVMNTTVNDLLGKSPKEFLTEDVYKTLNAQDEEVKKTGETSEMQLNLPMQGGTKTYIASKFPLYDEKGRLYALGSASFDITDIIDAHRSLEQAYQRQQKILNGLQKVLSASSDLLAVVNEKGEFVMLSDTSIELFGYTPKEMMSKNFIDFVTEEDKEVSLKIAKEIIEGRSIKEFTNHIIRKDGSVMPLIWSSEWVPEDSMMYCIARNATQKVRTEKELLQSQARLAHAQELAHIGSWDWDVENNHWSCSDEMYRLLGLPKEYPGDIQDYFLKAIHPDDWPEVDIQRKQLLASGNSFETEHRIVKSDSKVRYVHIKVEVAGRKNGQPLFISGTMQDITERKLAELKLQELNEMLAKRANELKESNAQLERFAYIASHDLQEPLRMVTSFLGLLEKRINAQLDETSKTYMHFAVDGADRMKGLINDLLEYSRIDNEKLHYTRVDLNEVIKTVLQTFDSQLKETGAEVDYPSMPVVRGNKVQLNQLFQNLVGNSLKYKSENNPVIEMGYEETDYEWKFFIKDNGIGIDPKFHEKVFVIFQRLHNRDKYSGTGIGLAISKKIVEHHGGRIWLTSTPGDGTTFHFTIKKHGDEKADKDIINRR